MLTAREPEGGLCRSRDHPQHVGDLHAALERVVGCLDLGCMRQDGVRHPQLRFLEFQRRHPLAGRPEEDVEEVLDDLELRVGGERALVRGPRAAQEDRVAEQTGLDEVGLRHPELLVPGLERPAVQETDLDRGFERHLAVEKGRNPRGDLGVLRRALDPVDVLVETLADQRFDVGESALGRDRGAPSQEKSRCEADARSVRGAHCDAPCSWRLIPHFGHSPSARDITSGCIGHT